MMLNDMTLGQIYNAAEANAQEYEDRYRSCSRKAFVEGACWAYEYLTKKGNSPTWCQQGIDI